MMESVNNNQFEVVPTSKSKRKVAAPLPNVYLNPGLDILANDDPMCNTAMEIVPLKKRKRSRSCDIVAFENSALDLGISKAALNAFLAKELENVRKNLRNDAINANQNDNNNLRNKVITNNANNNCTRSIALSNCSNTNGIRDIPFNKDHSYDIPNCTFMNDTDVQNARGNVSEPIYANVDDLAVIPFANAERADKCVTDVSNIPHDTAGSVFGIGVVNPNEISVVDVDDFEMDSGISIVDQKSINTVHSALECNDLSAISKTTNVQTSVTNQLFINNTSNLSLSFLDRLAIESPSVSNHSLYLDDDLNESNIMEIKTITIITKKKRIIEKKKNTNPFLNPNLNEELDKLDEVTQNPFDITDDVNKEQEYNDEVMNRPEHTVHPEANPIMPRRLFSNENNSTVSTVNVTDLENAEMQHEYENLDDYRAESPVYENIGDSFGDANFNKQSKILGCDVTQFSAADIMNLNKHNPHGNSSNESNETKRDLKHQILKASNKLSKRVFKTLKKKFKSDKIDTNATLNPYEVPRKLPKQKTPDVREVGFENPALNLDNSDEIEIEELDNDCEHQYETVKTLRNTRLNMNVTPLKERCVENVDISHNKTNTPSKKVRFDSTLNQEKVITGNSFDLGLQSPGFDAKIDKYHDELENCINERKFLEQNM